MQNNLQFGGAWKVRKELEGGGQISTAKPQNHRVWTELFFVCFKFNTSIAIELYPYKKTTTTNSGNEHRMMLGENG